MFAFGEQVDQSEQQLPKGMILQDKLAILEERLANLAKANAEPVARAEER